MRWWRVRAGARSGALDGEAGAGEAAGAAVVGEAPLLHQPDHQITSARPLGPDQRARRRGERERVERTGASGDRLGRSARRVEMRVEWAASLCLV